MAAGDLVVADYQYEFNGLLMGAASEVLVENITGLLSIPKNKVGRRPRQARHGSTYGGRTLVEERVVGFDVHLLTTPGTATETKLADLGEVFEPTDLIVPMVFQRPGRGKRRLYCKADRTDFTANYKLTKGDPAGSVELVAGDPFYYNNTETLTQATIAAGASSIGFAVTNAGRRPSSRVRIEITGTATNPLIQNVTDNNRQIRTVSAVSGANVLELDLFDHLVKYNAVNALGLLRNDNQWWELPKGVSNITFARTGTTGSATIKVYHRDAWAI